MWIIKRRKQQREKKIEIKYGENRWITSYLYSSRLLKSVWIPVSCTLDHLSELGYITAVINLFVL